MPTVIIIGGPNGAGNTTFANEYLTAEDRDFAFVNADEIARNLTTQSDILAARIMLDRIEALAAAGENVAIETTLANLGYARKISDRAGLYAQAARLRRRRTEADREPLYPRDAQARLRDLDDLRIVEEERELREGPGHSGMSAMIGLTARKPQGDTNA
ncbi:MAG: hypothetical protein HXY30_10285 [Pseudorhodoplanes sp.]|nr:hypothetical protein [Pseudorhodoplanes sp.]